MIKEYHLSSKKLWTEINEDFKEKGGAYILFFKDKGKIRPIARFIGIDGDGILYIGKATSYLDRVINLKKSLDPEKKSTAHICGRRYKKNKNIVKEFPFQNLYIRLFPHNNPEEKERELIDKYFNEFGEVPPLNANG